MAPRIRVELELNDGQFVTRMIHAGESVRRFNENVIASTPAMRQFAGSGQLVYTSLRSAEDKTRSFLGTLRDVTIVFGLARAAISNIHAATTGWAGDIIRVNAEVERLNYLMRSMSTAANPVKDAADQVNYLRRFALDAPFALNSITNSFVKMKATGIDPMSGSMQHLIDGIAAFGGSDDALTRATLGISQMAGKGVIQMEELRQQLGEVMPRAVELMARSMGISMSQLVKDISTGTVQAKPALNAFFKELDRTFGGSAEALMGSFSGMMQKLRTNLQLLATEAGEADYFRTVKEQIRDLNELLSSDMGKKMAQQLGQALGFIVEGLRDVLDLAIEFRGILENVAIALGVAFGGRIAIAGIMSLAGALGNVRTQISMFAAQWAGFQRQLQVNSWAVAVNQITNGAQGISRSTANIRAAGSVIALAGTALTGIASVLPVVTIGVLAVGEAFGLFSNRARDAWQELEKFGAASRKQAEEGAEYIAQREAELARLKARRDELAAGDIMSGQIDTRELDRLNKEILDKEAQLSTLRTKLVEFRQEGARNEDQRIAARQVDAIRERMRAMQNEYDNRLRALAQHHDKERTELLRQNRSVKALDDEYGRTVIAEQEKLYREKLKLLESAIADQEEIIRRSTGNQVERARMVLAELNKVFMQTRQDLEETLAKTPGSPMMAKAMNDEEAFAKGEAHLKRLQAEIKGLQAGLKGANVEVVELQELLSNSSKYGDLGVDKVRELIDQIVAAQAEQQKLKEMFEDREQLNRDLGAARARAAQELFEAVTRDLSEADKIRIRMQLGLYGDRRQSAMERTVEAIKNGFLGANEAAQEAGKSIRTDAFGLATINAGRQLLEVIGQLNDRWSSFRSNVRSTNIAAALSGGTLRGGLAGASAVSDSYISRLIQIESGGRADAQNPLSSARGIGQFIEKTWLEFLREMHPELTNTSREAMLALRDNVKLSTEAIEWLTRRNADALGKNNQPVTERNLYLSHFLGVGDAIKVLSSSLVTRLDAILSKQVIDANPQLAGKSVGWLLNEIDQKFRGVKVETEVTFTREQIQAMIGPDGRLRIPVDIDLDDNQRKELEEIEFYAAETAKQLGENAMADWIRDMNAAIAATSMGLEEMAASGERFGRRVAETRRMIQEGRFGTGDDLQNPEAERYQVMIETARRLDEMDKQLADARKARSDLDSADDRIARFEADIAEREAVNKMRLIDDVARKKNEAYFRDVRQLDEWLAAVRAAHGEESAIYEQALAKKEELLRRKESAEATDRLLGLREKNAELRVALENDYRAREQNVERHIALIRRDLELFQGTEEERVRLVAEAEEHIRLLREQAARQSPLNRMVSEWRNFAENIENAAVGWLNSTADAIAEFVTTGKMNFKSLADSIIKDIIRIATQLAISNLLGGLTGGSKGGSKGGVGMPLILAPTRHGGGIAGERLPMTERFVPLAAFAGAPRFHTGGIVGDEIPIIARKNEGVFTPAQMKALGPAGGVSQKVEINMPITLHATGGTPEQNADLSKRVGREIEGTLRKLVVDEILTQMRPGGIMARAW